MPDVKAKQSGTVGGGDAPAKKGVSRMENVVKKDKSKIAEPEEVAKTESQIRHEQAELRAMLRKKRFKRRWPEVTKVPIPTKKWSPPPPPRRPSKIVVEIPTFPSRKWVPPYMRQKRTRPKLPRIPPEEITQQLYACKTLDKIWHQFHQVDKGKMMLRGKYACNSKRYSANHCGAQTACIAVATKALLDEKNESELTRKDVDDLIHAGDGFYHQCIVTNKCYKGKPQLELNQLNPSFFFHDTKYTMKLTDDREGILAKSPNSTSDKPDLAQTMESLSGKEFDKILTVGDKNFAIWGRPSTAEAGGPPTVVYFFDPHMQNEIGQPDKVFFPYCCGAPAGGAAILRYAGVNAFVMDFLANYGVELLGHEKDKMPTFKLTDIEVAQKEPLIREPPFELDMKALKIHCRDEWENLNKNFLIERKLRYGEYPLASLSAVSLATARSRNKKKLQKFYQIATEKQSSQDPPVPPEKPPPTMTVEQVLEMRGEDFFLYCPKLDAHMFGRDDNVPLVKSETVLHSPVDLADQNFHSQFKQLDVEKWILRGTRHMASMRYSTFKTYTAIPCVLAALGMLRRYRARAWNEDMVDDTLDVGYNLFRESMVERGGPIRKLVLGELKDNFKMRDQEYTHKAKPIVVWGRMLSNDPKVFDLCRGIETFFKESDSGLLQIPGEFEMGIWNEGGKFYLYHPWPADESGNRVSLQGGGKACLLAFSRPRRLCEHILENTKDLRRKPFSISDVGVLERPTMPEPVNQMKPVAPNRWVIRGSFHSGDERFPEEHRNKQATPAAIAAIAMAHLVESPEWSSSEVDESLVRGDILYQNTMDHLSKMGISIDTNKPTAEEESAEAEAVEGEAGDVSSNASGNLAAGDVLNRFQMNEYDCIEAEVLDGEFSGELDPPSNRSGEVASLKKTLKKLFKEHNHCIFTSRGTSLAVWKHNDSFYVYDPRGCDENGYPSDDFNAAAALIRVDGKYGELADVLMGNLPPGADDTFMLSPIAITATKLNTLINAPETKLESKDMKWINKGTAAIMLGPRGENTAIGKAATKAGIGEDDQAGRKIALPAAAAFCAAAEAVPPPHMHHDHMYNLLEAGAEYYKAFVKKTGKKELEPEDLTEKFELGANTFSIELDEYMKLPLRLPDEPVGEGGGDDMGEGEQEEVDTIKQIKEALHRTWMDTTKPATLHLLVGDYHQLGVWMASGGKVIVFDPAPTLVKGLLTPQRIKKGDELRIQRLRDEMTGEGGFDDELGGEGEQEPVEEVGSVPPDSSPALMMFASPGEFIDKLVIQGGLKPSQFIAPYKLYPVTVTNELTSLLKEKKSGEKKERSEEETGEEAIEEEQLVDELPDAAIGKYYERLGRTKASVRGRVAQGENYFMEEVNRDLQDAANCVMGIVVDHIEPHIHWKPALIDGILKYGDRLHTTSLPFAKKPPRLRPHELQRKFKASGFYVKIKVDKEVVTGDTKAGDRDGVTPLNKGIAKFFEDGFKHGVLCSKDYCVGIWRTTDDTGYVLWDPHFVGPSGRTSPVGAATCVLFSNIEELADTFKENVEGLNRPGPNIYSICAVNVDWQLAKPGGWETKPSAIPDEGYEHRVLTAYVETAKGRTILRALKPTDMARFARDSIIQSASTAIVAACMSHIRKAALWTNRTLKDIQKAGCELCNRSLNALGYELRVPDEVLLPLQVLQRFILGTNYIRNDLTEIYSGKLEQRTHESSSLKSALEHFFEDHTHGILWVPPYAVAVWVSPGIPPFYMYDLVPCNGLGLRVPPMEDGTACVQTFTSPKLMAFSFLQNFPPLDRLRVDFILYAMRTFVTPIKRKTYPDPPLIKGPAGSRLVPATSKVNVDGTKRRASEKDRRHPPGDPTCMDVQRILEVRNLEDFTLKGQRNASGWLVLADGSQYLSAQHSMQCRKFSAGSRGNQALADAVMAVATSKIEDVCHWTSKTLDNILESGDQLYQDSYLQYKPPSKILQMEQVLRKFYAPGNCVCRVVVFEPRQAGLVDTDLVSKLTQFFREERCGVLVAGKGDFAVALFRTPQGYCMFDPDDRDRYARAVPPPCRGRARACFSQYPTVQMLAEKLGPNIPPIVRYEGDEEDEKDNKADTSKKPAETSEKSAETSEKPAEASDKPADAPALKKSAQDLKEKPKVYYTEAPTFKIYGMSVSSLRRINQFENKK